MNSIIVDLEDKIFTFNRLSKDYYARVLDTENTIMIGEYLGKAEAYKEAAEVLYDILCDVRNLENNEK